MRQSYNKNGTHSSIYFIDLGLVIWCIYGSVIFMRSILVDYQIHALSSKYNYKTNYCINLRDVNKYIKSYA